MASARPVATRPFRPGRDDEAWLAINNPAFADHPEQGGWTLDDLHPDLAVDWFDPDGFLMADAPDGERPARLVLDEDPPRHRPGPGRDLRDLGRPGPPRPGVGAALTVAGLQWMAGQGVTVGMLYATGSNTAAVTLYQSLGFTVDHVDRSYVRDRDRLPDPGPDPPAHPVGHRRRAGRDRAAGATRSAAPAAG